MGIIEMVFCIFLVLKLTGYIDWSWWYVFSPFYAYPVFFGLLYSDSNNLPVENIISDIYIYYFIFF